MNIRTAAALACTTLAGLAQAQEQPIMIGDIALGLSTNNAGTTTRQLRAGAQVGAWTALPFAQSFEYDNCEGPFSHSGNLLALNFGTTAGGGFIAAYSADGSNFGQNIYQFNAGAGGITTTRIGGLSVSPDNTKIATYGYDSGQVHILDYTPGTCGTGSGASVTNARSSAGLGNTGDTQGTTWLDNNIVIAYSVVGQPQGTALWTIPADDELNPTLQMFVSVPGNESSFTDVEYNPCLSPYIYAMFSNFANNVTENRLTIIDPRGGSGAWVQVAQLNLSGSLNTGREIAMGRDLKLHFAQFAGSGLTTRIYVDTLDLDPNSDGVVDAGDVAALTDNSTVDYYSETPGTSASFTGIDVVVGRLDCGAEPTGSCCVNNKCIASLTQAECEEQRGTYNGNGSVCDDSVCTPDACPCDWNDDTNLNSQDFFDFLGDFFSDNADFNTDGQTNSQDFFDFLGCFFTGCP